jgi:N-acetylglucosamine kinase-like BadF-type ATPase
VISIQGREEPINSLSELRGSLFPDPTLRNIVGLLQTKLELCARLPVLVFEAVREGDESGARLFRSLAAAEERQTAELLAALKQHLDQYGGGAAPEET